MKKDIGLLREFKANAVGCLATKLQITESDAANLVKWLEAEDMIKFESPEYNDKPAEVYTINKQLGRDELGSTSHKPGNIIINTYLDWKTLAGGVLALVETISGIASQNPIFIATGIFSWLISISSLTDIKIGENGTAIIMALQQHKKHRLFVITEQQCMKEANEILLSHDYKKMDEQTFNKEVANLERIKSIELLSENRIRLVEKVIFHF